MLNETMIYYVNATAVGIAQTDTSIWVKLLAILGLVFISRMMFSLSLNVVYLIAYIYGFLKWLIIKVKTKKVQE